MEKSRSTPGAGMGGLERYAGYGMAWVLAALLGSWLGIKLDAWLGTSPLLVVVGALLGAAAGTYTIYVRLIVEPAAENKDSE